MPVDLSRQRLSIIAHAELSWACPLASAKVDRLLTALRPAFGSHVLDLGCGRGAVLARLLHSRPDLTGTGLDHAEPALARGRADHADLIDAGRLRLVHGDAALALGELPSVQTALCLGSTHALGGLAPTLDALATLLPVGGVALVGDGTWMREPEPAYLDLLGAASDELMDLREMAAAAADRGWTVRGVVTSNLDEWDHYEWSWIAALERWAAEHPDDLDAPQAREMAERHRQAYLGGGRETLGFAVLVLSR